MKRISALLLAAVLAAPACSSDQSDDDGMGSGSGSGSGSQTVDQWEEALNERVLDYNAALRIAALRLTGALPTMTEINQVANAGDAAAQKVAYEGLVQGYMNRPKFAKQMMYFWRDTFKMGETAILDTAPAFAAKLTVENG